MAEAYQIRAVAFETADEAADATQEAAEAATAGGGVGAEGTDVNNGSGAEGTVVAKPPRKNDGSLDFGRRRVGDSATERFTLRNRYVLRWKRSRVCCMYTTTDLRFTFIVSLTTRSPRTCCA